MTDTQNLAYSDVLKFLNIKNIVFDFENGNTALLKPEKISGIEWICFASTTLPAFGKVNLELKDFSFSSSVMTELIEGDIFEYKLVFLEALPNSLIEKLKEYKKLIVSIEKRKEERFEIGLKKWQDFNLFKADQRLYIDKSEYLKCILNNVSVHGALITGEASKLNVSEDIVKLAIRFSNPEEIILQSAIICRIEHKTPQLFRYSLQFLEPLSLSWQMRIESFAEKLELKNQAFLS